MLRDAKFNIKGSKMSITFFVKNKKKFLVGLAPLMSVEEALRLVPNLSQFNAPTRMTKSLTQIAFTAQSSTSLTA